MFVADLPWSFCMSPTGGTWGLEVLVAGTAVVSGAAVLVVVGRAVVGSGVLSASVTVTANTTLQGSMYLSASISDSNT